MERRVKTMVSLEAIQYLTRLLLRVVATEALLIIMGAMEDLVVEPLFSQIQLAQELRDKEMMVAKVQLAVRLAVVEVVPAPLERQAAELNLQRLPVPVGQEQHPALVVLV